MLLFCCCFILELAKMYQHKTQSDDIATAYSTTAIGFCLTVSPEITAEVRPGTLGSSRNEPLGLLVQDILRLDARCLPVT